MGLSSCRQRYDLSARLLLAVMLSWLGLALLPTLARAGDANRTSCPNESTEGFRVYLPDCRAYEQVTPPFKGGFASFIEGISENGSELYLQSFGAFSHIIDTGEFGANYQTARTSSGWALAPFDVPPSTFLGFKVEAVSPDLSSSLWLARSSPQQAIPDFYLGVSPHGPFTHIGPSGPATFGERALELDGVSRDLSHSFYVALAPSFGNRSPLWPGDRTADLGQPSLYEYSGTNNIEPRLVGVSNAGPTKSIAEADLVSECGTYLGGLVANRAYAYNAVSENGNTAFFTALGRDYGICGSEGVSIVEPDVNEVYARLDGSRVDARTVAISEPTKETCDECNLSEKADAEFRGASADGSKVFFTTAQHLLSSANEVGPDLYEYDFNDPEGKRLTQVSAGDLAGARVQSVLCVSNDGSHVYFVAQGVLATAGNAFGEHAEEGAENVYVYEHDALYPQGHLAFIGTAKINVAQTTPDGRFLVFESTADLTPDEQGQGEAGQVFEYDAKTGFIVRVSRGEAGYNEDGNSSIYAATIPYDQIGASIPIAKFTGLAMSADGAYVFFASADGLTHQTPDGVMNIYEYHDGRVALISDGRDLVKVYGQPAAELVGTDASGKDVYFETADQLVGQDTDTQLDVYDARIEGGFQAAPVNPGCSEDVCQGVLSGGTQPVTPSTALSEGEGQTPLAVSTRPKSKKKPVFRKKKPVISKHAKKKQRKAGSHKVMSGGRR